MFLHVFFTTRNVQCVSVFNLNVKLQVSYKQQYLLHVVYRSLFFVRYVTMSTHLEKLFKLLKNNNMFKLIVMYVVFTPTILFCYM